MPENSLYRFSGEEGTFLVEDPYRTSYCYFPLTNKTGTLLSSISPNLAGDIKKDNDHFLTPPATAEDIQHNPLCRRDFFIRIGGVKNTVYRLSQTESKNDTLEAGLLYHKITKKTGLIEAEITNFIPHQSDAEVMRIRITNTSRKSLTLSGTSFIPLYGRGEKNLRDHRHVSSLLNRIHLTKHGIILQPSMVFDETGHTKNETAYYVYGFGNNQSQPAGYFPTLLEFCGERGTLDKPEAITKKKKSFTKHLPRFDGKEACGALRFKPVALPRGKSAEFTLIMGIASTRSAISPVWKKLNSSRKVSRALKETKKFWQESYDRLSFDFGDSDYNNWLKWVQIQPTLRKLFGCSFLPHFDYGKGGRGFRDLWQDTLSLILKDEEGIDELILNNFKSIRIDGSNATIITHQEEFIPDRNKISRVWTDHGVWPLLSTCLFLHRSGNFDLLLKEAPYFRDAQLKRSRQRDPSYDQKEPLLSTKTKRAYTGSVLEHLLIQNLVQFFNVGQHNILRLENGDWNDGLDMAPENGECVPFYCMYAHNLLLLCELLYILKPKTETIQVLKELSPLLDRTFHGKRIDYKSASAKRKVLEDYMEKTKLCVSGEKIEVPIDRVIEDLKAKAKWIHTSMAKKEWLTSRFFNGYYDNAGKRVEGTSGKSTRMLLQSQVFPILAGTAKDTQIASLWDSINRHLKDETTGGYRLNTDFKDIYPDLGRAFGFSYGDKENGAFFNHMVVLLSYAFYKRNFVTAADSVFHTLYGMSIQNQARIYPMLPEYFNSSGRGLYGYLTGSASWYIYTLFEQILGIVYSQGDLIINPKLTAHNFSEKRDTIELAFRLHGRSIRIQYKHSGHRTIHAIDRVLLGKETVRPDHNIIRIKKKKIMAVDPDEPVAITVLLR